MSSIMTSAELVHTITNEGLSVLDPNKRYI